MFNGGSLPGHTNAKNVNLNSGGGLLGGGIIQSLTLQSGGYIDFTDGVATALTVQSSLTLGTGRSLSLDLGALFHDGLTIQGQFAAGGSLIVEFAGGTPLKADDTFDLITAASYQGAFDQIDLPELDANLVWDTARLSTHGVLSITQIPEPGAFAGLAGLAAFAFAAGRRRRSASSAS